MTTAKTKFKHIIITGASSGIGAALAKTYAKGGLRLGLTGRNGDRLEEVAGSCRQNGTWVDIALMDVREKEIMAGWLQERDEEQPVDLVIANAGISAGTGGSKEGENPEQIRDLFEVNVTGVFNTIDPLIPRMIERGGGHIALMSSLAAYRGWPGAPAYCASKAAVRVFGEGLRGALADTGVEVSVICPGFVESPMSAMNDYSMPFLMPADKAAGIIIKNIEKNQGRIAFPLRANFFAWLIASMPDSFAQKILKGTPAKGASN